MRGSGSQKYSGGDYKTNIRRKCTKKGKQNTQSLKMKGQMSTNKTEI
jgi:hypothetical protein